MVLVYQSNDSKNSEAENEAPKIAPMRNSHMTPVFREQYNAKEPVDIIVNSTSFNDVATKIVEIPQIENIETKPNGKTVSNSDNETLSIYMRTFLKEFEEANKFKGTEFEANINVSDVLGGVARFYEKIRTTVEYKGEHLLRRNAIERILKRLIWEKDKLKPNTNQEKMATSLVKELIWAKYIPNNEISTGKVNDVRATIEKYLNILEGLDNYPEKVSVNKARLWIMGVASSEIEDLLDPSQRDLFVKLMYLWLCDHSQWNDKGVPDHEKETQIYLAIHRAFTRSDDPTMRYYLLLREIPDWNVGGSEVITKFVLNFPKYYNEIENHLNFKNKLTLYRKILKHSSSFEILRQVVLKNINNIDELLKDGKKFDGEIREVCEDNYKKITKRVNTGIVRSIVYIFITKVFLALMMEVPFEVYRYGDIKYIPLTINIVFPSIMMFLIGISIKIPGVKNTQSIVDRIMSIVYMAKDTKAKINFDSATGSAFVKTFGIIYMIIFTIVFGGISSLLFKIGYSLIGVMVFFFFLSLVLLFAFRVRYYAQSLKVEVEKEGILGHLFSYLSLPFLNLGFILSRGLAQINVFTVLLDLLIEAPLKNMIELFEEWIGFIREKRQEVIEVPE